MSDSHPTTENQAPKPPHDLALPKITIQMLGDYGQEGFFEQTDKPVEGIAGVNWSQASVDFACEIVRPAVWAEIERLRIEVDKYDSAIAQRDLQIEQLQKDLRSSHAAYNAMLDKAAQLERRLSGDSHG